MSANCCSTSWRKHFVKVLLLEKNQLWSSSRPHLNTQSLIFLFFFYLFSSTSHVTWMRKLSVHFTWSCRIKMPAFDPGTEQRDWGKRRAPQLIHYSQCTGGHNHTQVFRSEGRWRDSNWKNEKIKVAACAYEGGDNNNNNNNNIFLDVYLLYSSMCWTICQLAKRELLSFQKVSFSEQHICIVKLFK